MRIYYKQRYGITYVTFMNDELQGVSSVRPSDKYNKNLGFAIAMVKAHASIPSHEVQYVERLMDVPLKSFQVPEETMGQIVKVMLQYRQALGRVHWVEEYDEGHYHRRGTLYVIGEPKMLRKYRYSDGMEMPEAEASEIFGHRLLKSTTL